MDDVRQQAERILSGKDGDSLRSLARTPEARRLSQSAAAAQLQKAVEQGDGAALQKALAALLSTPEGRTVAESLGRLGHG